jgi:hypothetical protein
MIPDSHLTNRRPQVVTPAFGELRHREVAGIIRVKPVQVVTGGCHYPDLSSLGQPRENVQVATHGLVAQVPHLADPGLNGLSEAVDSPLQGVGRVRSMVEEASVIHSIAGIACEHH